MKKVFNGAQVTRFAPSPTGYLHIGHAFSALTAYNARGQNGTFHVRIEDIDPVVARLNSPMGPEDLQWLGWIGNTCPPPVRTSG